MVARIGSRPLLVVPAALAISALTVVGCGPDGGDDTTSDDSAADDGATGAGDETATDGGLAACSDLQDQASCEAESDCLWDDPHSFCFVRCELFDDEQTCDGQGYCYWDSDSCEFGGI